MRPNAVVRWNVSPARARQTLRWMLFSGLGVCYYAFARYSAAHQVPVLCPFRRLTGLRCPLCGFTTSTAHLLEGDLRGALRAHPLGPVILLGALVWYGRATGEIVQRWFASQQKGMAHHGYEKR